MTLTTLECAAKPGSTEHGWVIDENATQVAMYIKEPGGVYAAMLLDPFYTIVPAVRDEMGVVIKAPVTDEKTFRAKSPGALPLMIENHLKNRK